jgi:hypothetical protein
MKTKLKKNFYCFNGLIQETVKNSHWQSHTGSTALAGCRGPKELLISKPFRVAWFKSPGVMADYGAHTEQRPLLDHVCAGEQSFSSVDIQNTHYSRSSAPIGVDLPKCRFLRHVCLLEAYKKNPT